MQPQKEADVNNTEKVCKPKLNKRVLHSFAIDKKMWRFKLHFFLFIGGIATVFPFVPHFAKRNIGISTTSLAVILMVQLFLFIISKPVIGYLADYFNKLKAMICILTITQGLCFALILLIPKITHTSPFYFMNPTQCASEENGGNTSSTNHNHFIIVPQSSPSSEFEQVKELSPMSSLNGGVPFVNGSVCTELQFVRHQVLKCHPTDVNTCECFCLGMNENCWCIDFQFTLNTSNTPVNCLCHTVQSEQFHPLANVPDITPIREFLTYQFWIFAIIYTIAMVCNNAVFTLSDTACCESVEGAGADFGRQRLWGAIGWGTMAPLAGLLTDFTGEYLSAWIAMEVCMCLVLWNVSQLDLKKPHFSKNILKDVGTVFKSGEFLVFEAGLLMNGMGASLIWYYLVLFLISIGGSKLLCGLSLTVQSFLGTLPLMYFSGQIIKRIGHLNVVSLALVMYTARFLWYSYLYNPWLVLIVELLHGLTYGLLYANIASFGKQSSKPGTEATTQAVLFSTHEGLGGGIGCVLGGMGLDKFGGHQTFFIAGLFTGCGFLLHQLGALLIRRRRGNMKVAHDSNVNTNGHI